ncbi:hypothetical protein [Streptomyces platensis]
MPGFRTPLRSLSPAVPLVLTACGGADSGNGPAKGSAKAFRNVELKAAS